MPSDAPLTGSWWLPAQVGQDKVFNQKYLIERELGVGGYGVVVCARHLELDERVAIKFLLPGLLTHEAVARFRLEARAAHRVKNEHVVRIIDVSTTEGGIPYIVMEYLEGIDLERMLQQNPKRQLPIPDAIEFVLQACEAVAESHSLEIVHRDLKPSNLFCIRAADGLPMIKVLDYGISKLGSTTIETEISGGTRILGSPQYMSPEQFESSTDVDHRTDIWSIGIMLYELITGAVPFSDREIFRLRERIRGDVPRQMADFRGDMPAGLQPVVLRCLEKDRNKRYPNLAELAKALFPFAPQRARTSIARIVRTVEAPGCATGSLALPSREATLTDSPTIESIPPAEHSSKGRRRISYWVGAAAGLALLGSWGARRHWLRPPNADHAAPSAVATAPVPDEHSAATTDLIPPPLATTPPAAATSQALAAQAALPAPAQSGQVGPGGGSHISPDPRPAKKTVTS